MTARAAIFGAAAAVILGACLLPLLWPTLALLSIGGGVGLGLLADPVLWHLLARTLGVAAAVLGLALMIGLPMAVLTARTDVAGRGVALVIHAFPALLPPFLPALGWFHLLGRQGLIGNDASAALLFSDVGVIFVLGLALAPIFTALTALSLWNIDPSQEEAGRVVASPMRVAARILLPASRPAIVLAGVVVAALTLSEVGVPTFLRART